MLVTGGKMKKQVAGDLGLSEITVKIHRGAAMRKMGAWTLADLVRMADALNKNSLENRELTPGYNSQGFARVRSSSCSRRIFAANPRKGSRVPAGNLISIIDDDKSMRGALVALVRSAGYDARGFASAVDFLASAAVQSFACIVTDIQMPGMSGIELKEHLTASQLPVPGHHDHGTPRPGS